MSRADDYRACAAAGMTQREAARCLGVSSAAISEFAARNGISFRDGRKADSIREAKREMMRRLNADSAFAARNRDRMRVVMRLRQADPAFNPLAALTPSQRADYDLLRDRAGYSRAEALRSIGRADLCGGAA